MTTYLIDYENVSHHGFEGYAKLGSEDTVVVFTGATSGSSSIPVDVVRQMTAPGDTPHLLWKRAKKTMANYLDFQLVSYLGYLIGNPEVDATEFVIVSKDRGFEACVDFWAERRRELRISVRPTIAPAVQAPAPERLTVGEATKKKVRAAVKPLGLTPSVYSLIYRELAGAADSRQLRARLVAASPEHGETVSQRLQQAGIAPESQ